ncbi:MAG: hypothetical protein V2A73_00335 [Pseudomonadota bacterium]
MYINQKVTDVSNDAKVLWIWALDYSADQLTDGILQPYQVAMLAGILRLADFTPIVKELIDAGLFEMANGNYMIHDYLKYNPSREEVLADRAENAKRQAEWQVKKKAEKQRYQEPDNSKPNTVSEAVSNAPANRCPVPDPVPDPNTHAEVSPSGNGAKRQRQAQPTPRAPNAAYGLFAAYCRGLDIDPSKVPRDSMGGYMKSATALLQAEYTADEVERCTRETKRQPFWQDKALHLRQVAQEIPQWKQSDGKPKREVNDGRTTQDRGHPGEAEKGGDLSRFAKYD